MTNEQIIAQIQKGKGNEKELLTELYKNNIGFIRSTCAKYHSRVNPSEYDDLEQECFIGLYEAIQRYDSERDSSFLTFAKYYSTKCIVQYIRHKTTALRIPNEQIVLITKYRKYTMQMLNDESRKPTDEEYRDYLGISERRLNGVRELSKRIETRSLNEPIFDDGETNEIVDTIPDETTDIENAIIDDEYDREIKAVLWDEIDNLDEKDSYILRERYIKNRTLVDIGRDLGMTHEGARQRESRALNKLKKNLRILNLVQDDIREQSTNRVGLRFYLNHGSSSVEWAVLKIDKYNEQKQRVNTQIDSIIDYQKEIIRGNHIKHG